MCFALMRSAAGIDDSYCRIAVLNGSRIMTKVLLIFCIIASSCGPFFATDVNVLCEERKFVEDAGRLLNGPLINALLRRHTDPDIVLLMNQIVGRALLGGEDAGVDFQKELSNWPIHSLALIALTCLAYENQELGMLAGKITTHLDGFTVTIQGEVIHNLARFHHDRVYPPNAEESAIEHLATTQSKQTFLQ